MHPASFNDISQLTDKFLTSQVESGKSLLAPLDKEYRAMNKNTQHGNFAFHPAKLIHFFVTKFYKGFHWSGFL